MKRLLPSSLLGQVMVSVTLALLVAQVVSAVLLYRAGEDRRETAILTQAAFQIINGAEREEQRTANRAERAERRAIRRQGGQDTPSAASERRNADTSGGLPRLLRYDVTDNSPVADSESAREAERTDQFRSILAEQGIAPSALITSIRRAGDDPYLIEFAQSRPRFRGRTEWQNRRLYVAAIQREAGGIWETARVLEPRRAQAAIGILLFQTLVTFGFLIAILFLVLRRITRPLADLTERVGDFSQHPGRVVRLEESGPADTRRLIAAHNAMETRIASMLDEKDVMLGAIGHDLKTPLAALRVRIESVPDDAQRQKMADSIEDITATLDDILTLARVGHAIRPGVGASLGPVDIRELAISVVEEFEDLGEPVRLTELPPETDRIVARIQETWAKRALRNLVSNAVRYGTQAELSVLIQDGHAVLRVDDRGPGIPADRIADMQEPFTRGEASRNRSTGGAGLGLALARAIAQQHGGRLVLTNLTAENSTNGNRNGLRAELFLPL